MKPKQIAIFILITLAALAAVCYFFPRKGVKIGSTEINMPPLQEVLQQDSDVVQGPDAVAADTTCYEPAPETIATDTLPHAGTGNDNVAAGAETPVAMTADSETAEKGTTVTPPATATADSTQLADTRVMLERFYAALAGTDTAAVRVVHYGDSQTEGDRMTMNLRQGLQQICGGGGVGLVPLHQTISMRTITQTLTINGVKQTAQQGPKRYLAYGPKGRRRDNRIYGPMAQVALMDNNLCKGSEKVTVGLTQSRTGTTRPFTRIVVYGETDSTITLPDSAMSYTLELKRKGDIYGLSLETETGVMVDNIPMRGCAGTIFTGIDRKMLAHYYKKSNTRLIIMQFGGNVMPYTHSRKDIAAYVEKIRRQIKYIRSCAPEADLLFIGPSDMLTTRNGVKTSYSLLPDMDAALLQMAVEEGAAYWSLFGAMGGKGGMKNWISKGLAGSDGVHFTRKGADFAGEMLTKWLLDGRQEYLEKLQKEAKPEA